MIGFGGKKDRWGFGCFSAVCWWSDINLMTLKQLNSKQAQKWLEKLKAQNLQSYKDITKFLRKYQRTNDDHDCYVKISHTLLSHAELTKEINGFLEEPNKFVINRPEDQKIKELMGYVKKNRPEVFQRIISLIKDLSRTNGENHMDISKGLKPRLRQIINGDAQLERITQEALDLSGEELISRKNLQHLKMPKPVQIEEEREVIRPPNSQNQQRRQHHQIRPPPGRPEPKPFIIPFTNPSDERAALKQLERQCEPAVYLHLVKLIRIYALNIITRNQVFELLGAINLDQIYMECVKDILDARQTERRKQSLFRPLNDTNFANIERPSPSYVATPIHYPITCKGKTPQIRLLLNDRLVSVPYGSEESENFSVRNKNSNQINLLKAEDQRYQFDIYMIRLKKASQILDKLLNEEVVLSEEERTKLINQMIGMGALQVIYKNCHREQREELQWFLKSNPLETCRLFKERIAAQIAELDGIKEVHAIKAWNEVASKNFFKALDLKGFEFKKNEKDHMKANFFLAQLQERSRTLDNGGQSKTVISFEDKKDFFSIFNSFESSSRTERCTSRSLPQVQSFNLQDEARRRYYPLIIMAFQDEVICQQTYSLISFYIETAQMGQVQKHRCRAFLEQVLVSFLGWKLPIRRMPSESLDEEKLYGLIGGSGEEVCTEGWVTEEQQTSVLQQVQPQQEALKMGYLADHASEYSYLPAKSEEKAVIYGSEHLYTLARFIYAVYERLIRMREVAEKPEKLKLFELLFFACIKAKEGVKFEENLNSLFGKHAYLFSTMYKVFDNLLKSLSNASSCAFNAYSIRHAHQPSQQLYFIQLNRFCLANNLSNNKILRLTFNHNAKTLYVNSLESYYRSDDLGKDIGKKRVQIAKSIEIYTVDNFNLDNTEPKASRNKDLYQRSGMEYIFEGSSIFKMLNHSQKEDLLTLATRKPHPKTLKRQLKRVHRLLQRTQ